MYYSGIINTYNMHLPCVGITGGVPTTEDRPAGVQDPLAEPALVAEGGVVSVADAVVAGGALAVRYGSLELGHRLLQQHNLEIPRCGCGSLREGKYLRLGCRN